MIFLYNKKETFIYKKKWVLAICILMLINYSYQFINDINKEPISFNADTPEKKDIENKFFMEGKYAANDITYKYQDLFSIEIPKGFKYLPLYNEQMKFLIRDGEFPNISGIVIYSKSKEGLFTASEEIISEISASNEEFEIISEKHKTNEKQDILVSSFKAIKNKIETRGQIVIAKKGEKILTLYLGAEKSEGYLSRLNSINKIASTFEFL